MGRVISYGEKTGYNDGDYLLMDNGDGGTKRIRADRVGVQLDQTVSQLGKAPDASFVKTRLDLKADKEAVDKELSEKADVSVVGQDINRKVSKPSDSPNGTSGQVLRTNGDGTTQWVDVGLPSDQQTSSAVTSWLNAHPEATTTVQDGSLTHKKLVNGTLGYVTPEMYGAVGDGVTDDTQAIQAAMDSGYNVLFFDKTYASSRIVIRRNNLVIDGSGATLLFGANSGFTVSQTVHNIVIQNLKFRCEYTVDSDATTNVCLAIAGSGDSEYFAHDIKFNDCSFDGGVMGVAATSVRNLTIENCQFGSFVYKPTDRAGGYGILLQSCINVNISSCDFVMGGYGRHDVYVSVDQTKTMFVQCKNIVIDRCHFDHTNLVLESGSYYSPATQSINIRSSSHTVVKNCYFKRVTGALAYISEDGIIDGAVVSDCIVETPVYNSGSSEARNIIGYNGTQNNHVTGTTKNVTVINILDQYSNFMSLKHSTVQVEGCKIGPSRIICGENVTIQINDIITDIQYYFIRFNGGDETKGSCKNITFTSLTGGEYYFSDGSYVSAGFFKDAVRTVALNIEQERISDLVNNSNRTGNVAVITGYFKATNGVSANTIFARLDGEETVARSEGLIWSSQTIYPFVINGGRVTLANMAIPASNNWCYFSCVCILK